MQLFVCDGFYVRIYISSVSINHIYAFQRNEIKLRHRREIAFVGYSLYANAWAISSIDGREAGITQIAGAITGISLFRLP